MHSFYTIPAQNLYEVAEKEKREDDLSTTQWRHVEAFQISELVWSEW
jgi:hypothetical protein